jgi:hypothetical protein
MNVQDKSLRTNATVGSPTSLFTFVAEIARVVETFPIYGMAVVVFTEQEAKSFQYGMEDRDFLIACQLISEHGLTNE